MVKNSKQNIQANKLTAFKLNQYKIKAGCKSELVKRLLEADDIIERSCLEPHSWPKHQFAIKKVSDEELIFDFTGPKVDHGNFINKRAPKNEPKEYESTVSSHIIWDHDDEYDVSQTAKIELLYF